MKTFLAVIIAVALCGCVSTDKQPTASAQNEKKERTITITGDRLKIGGGNSLSGTRTSIAGGRINTNAGNYSTIAGGFYNSINSAASNSFIGGGNNNLATYYNGTIGGGSYNIVSLLSTIGGGAANSALGEYATIGGGIANSAPGASCTVAGGEWNNAEAEWSTIGGGGYNSIVFGGEFSVISGGETNTVFGGTWASIGGGLENTVSASYTTIPGGFGASASKLGQFAHASGYFVSAGDAQRSVYTLRNTTTNQAQTELFLDGSSLRLQITTGSTWTFDIQVVARSLNGSAAGYKIKGVINNNSGNTSFVAAPTVETLAEDVANWNATVEADDNNINDALVIKVTGAASTNIRWVATVETTEVKY
jgi:hypothetical protein